MTVDVSDLRDAVLDWSNQAGGGALDSLGQEVRDKAPYGTSEDPRASGAHLVDTMEAIVTGTGETWTGELAFTADYASYVDEGRGPIEGNPLLYFYWQGHLISVHSVGPQERTGFFTDNVSDDAWADHVERALDATSPG